MDTKALRQKILDLAIRGKLVPQNPDEEPASVLLEKIRAEKRQMVKDGKLKAKDIKRDTEIFRGDDNLHYEKFADGTVKCIEDEIPFEVPEGWAWCRIAAISSKVTDGEHKTPRRIDSFYGYYLLSARNIQNGFISLEDVDYVDEEEYANISLRCNPQWGDILISCSGSVGRVTVVSDTNCYVMVRSAAMIRPISINSYYLMYALQSSVLQKQIQESSKQTAQANLFQGAICSLLIPIPSKDEQKKVVDSLMKKNIEIKKIETSKTDLLQLVKITKSCILDLAIRGKLVPQNPDDEPASVLLDRIRAEKEELIKQGKLKRDKRESIIFKGDDNSYYEKFIDGSIVNINNEIYFGLPDGWIWLRGRNCFASMESRKPDGEYFDYIDIDSVNNKNNTISNPKHILCSEAPSRASRAVFDGSVVFSLVRPYLKNIAYIDESLARCIASTGFYVCTSNGILYSKYMFLLLISDYTIQGLNQYMKGDNSPSIRRDDIESWLFPIPPYNEQIRIVQQWGNYNAEFNEIEASLI